MYLLYSIYDPIQLSYFFQLFVGKVPINSFDN